MKRTILILFVTSLLVGSCSFFNDDYQETLEQFVSVAYKSDNADFSQYETYVVADSILYVDGDKNVRKKNDLTDEVKSVIAGAMNALGYTPFIASSASSKPDLILDLSYIVSTMTGSTHIIHTTLTTLADFIHTTLIRCTLWYLRILQVVLPSIWWI